MSNSEELIDDDLIIIFIEEARDLLHAMQEIYVAWQKDYQDRSFIVRLQRELHTFKGGARMVNQDNISFLAHELESLYERILKDEVPLNNNLNTLVDSVHGALANMVECLAQKKQVHICDAVINQIRQLAPHEYIETFLSEAKNIFSNLNSLLSSWQLDLANISVLQKIQIEIGNFKSNALIINQPTINNFCDHVQKFYSKIIKGSIAPSDDIFKFSCNLQHQLYEIVEAVKNGKIPSIAKELLEELLALIQQDLSKNKNDTLSTLQQNKQIRMHPDLLERVINLSDENSIINVHLGMHVNQINDFLDEAKLACMKLSEQYPNIFFDFWDKMKNSIAATDEILRRHTRVSEGLQSSLLKTRMLSFSSVVPRLKRIVNRLAIELKKDIDFKIDYIEGEIDRVLLDKIVPVVEHLLRNALDHGVESKSIRLRLSKPEKAIVSLKLFKIGADIMIEISDDGAGIDIMKVRKKAIEMGLINKDQALSDQQSLRLILLPGFSVREKVTQISGRGVGMDAVNTEIQQLGGTLSIKSIVGKGTSFLVTLPLTSSLNHGLMIKVVGKTYVIPLSSVVGVARVTKHALLPYCTKGTVNFFYLNKPYKVSYLGELLGVTKKIPTLTIGCSLPLLILRGIDLEFAVLVDEILGSREMMIKSLGAQFNQLALFSGATITAAGDVVMILDPNELGVRHKAKMVEYQNNLSHRLVLVVDDSLTIRKATSNLLIRHNYEVILAKDGLEAMHKIEKMIPDIILLDIEMPEVNGFELSSFVRSHERAKNIPIIMITSKTGQKYKEQAMALGVDKFLGKPYQSDQLLSLMQELLGADDSP